MKSTLQLSLVLSFFLLSITCWSQFPENFEFLEHRHVLSYPGAQKLHGDDVYYVSHNTTKPMTLINKVGADRSFEVLFREKHFSCRSKLFEESDGSFQIVLHSLFDYDIGVPGIFVINVDGESISIDTLGGYERFPDKLNFNVDNIAKDKDGNWITFSDSLYTFNKNGIIKSSPLPSRIYGLNLFTNHQGDVFATQNRSWNENSTLFHFINNELVPLHSYNNSNLKYLAHTEEGIYLGVGNKVLYYDSDCSAVINEWELPISKPEFRNATYRDDELELMVADEEKSIIFQLSESDGVSFVHGETNKAEGYYYHFDKLSDDQYLFTGTSSLEDITRNVFFRNINVIDNSQVQYPKSDVAVTDLVVVNTNKDTINVNVNAQGDTVVTYSYTYDVSISLLNNSFEDYEVCNAFSDHNMFPFGISEKFSFEVEDFSSSSLVTRDSSTIRYYSPINEMKFVVPGADYKFNVNPNKVITTRVLSSIREPEFTKSFDVFPNPCSSIVNLRLDSQLDEIRIYNNLGHPVYYSNRSDKQIDLSDLPAGHYLIHTRTKTDKHTYVSKFVKI